MKTSKTNHLLYTASFTILFFVVGQAVAAQNDTQTSEENFQIAAITPDQTQQNRNKRLSDIIGRGKSILNTLSNDEALQNATPVDASPSRVGTPLSRSEEAAYEQKLREWMAEETEPQDIILSLSRKGGSLKPTTILGIQKGIDVYLPLKQLSDILRFDTQLDLDNQVASGFAGNEQKTFSLNLNTNVARIAGRNFSLGADSVILQDFGAGLGDFYVREDIINELLDLRFDVEFSSMTLNLNSPRLLPIELEEQRRQRQENLLRSAQGDDQNELSREQFIPNDYELLGKPALNLSNQLELSNSGGGKIRNVFSVRGASDLLKTSADYSGRILSEDEDRLDIGNLRLRLQRRADAGHELPFGVKRAEAGDISTALPNLVRLTANGAGLKFSNKKLDRPQTFDTIVVEGASEPGWDVEVYNGNQLLDFSTVDNHGEYRFEDVQLTFGKNKIKTILYGPQGQLEERIENYNITNVLLPSGEVEYNVSLLDANEDFIPFLNEGTNERTTDGFLFTGTAKFGLNESISPFVTATSTNSQEGRKKYVSAGADFSALGGIARVEGYKELGAGTALDARYSTNFAGIRLNARSSFFNDFESEEAQFGNTRQTREYELRSSKSIPSSLGNFSVGADVRHTDFADDSSRRFAGTDLSYANQKTRLTHSTNTTWEDGRHQNSGGLAGLTYKLSDTWNMRSTLDYEIFPEKELRTARFQARYTDLDKFTSSFNVNRNLQNDNTVFSLNADYDFDTYLAGIGLDWDMDEGLQALLRTNMSLGPFGENDTYIASSESLLGRSKLETQIFKDEDGDGVFSENDQAIADAKININRQTKGPTNEDGYYTTDSPGRIGLASISVDEKSLDDEYLMAGGDRYTTIIRPVSKTVVNIPLVASGAIDGNIYFTNGNPSPTVSVELVNEKGQIIEETSTDFNGYYSFQRIRPGNYTIQTRKSNRYTSAPVTASVSNDQPFVFGIDLQIAALENPNASKPNIKTRLKNLIAKFEKRKATL